MDDETLKNVLETSIMDDDRKIAALLKKKDAMEKKILEVATSRNRYFIAIANAQYAILKGVNTLIANTRMFREATIEELKNLNDKINRG